MVVCILGFVGGVLLYMLGLSWLMLLGIVMLVITLSCLRRQYWRQGVLLLLMMSIGYLWSGYDHWRTHQWQLPTSFITQTVNISGVIASLPRQMPHAQRFLFHMRQFNHQAVSAVLRLSWYQHGGSHFSAKGWHRHKKIVFKTSLQVGDQWDFKVRLKPPHGLRNPGGFDYQRWLEQHGIAATGYVVSGSLQPHSSSLLWLEHLRQIIQHHIQQSIQQPALAAIISALTVGSRALLTSPQWEVFRLTGTSHLVAISGLHIGLVAAVIYFLIRALWCWFPWLVLRYPAPLAGAWGAGIGAWIYALLAGFSLPTQRAVIMITVFMLASICYRSAPVWRRLLLAFGLVIFCHPMALMSASFWLSFSAVAWIGYGMSSRVAAARGWRQWLRVQWVVSVGLLPLTLFFFTRISLVTFFANFIAIPWISFIVVPLCLIACLGLLCGVHQTLFWLAGKALAPLWWYLQWLTHWPLVSWHHMVLRPWILLTTLIAMALLLAPRGWPGRCLAGIWLLPLFFYRPPTPLPGQAWLTVLDVGQGLAVVVRTAKHTLIYDTGPKSYSGFDAGQSVVLPYLEYVGVSHIDTLVISHGDIDHRGGAKAILAALPVARILTSVPALFHHSNVIHCHAGQSWQWDGVLFKMLSPKVGQPYHGNNSSCVLKVEASHQSVLLPGDIEKKQEQWLLKHQALSLPATVIVAPHHGSATSSSDAFVKKVAPTWVLFSTGYYNHFHFPAAAVIARYHQLKVKQYNTAKNGAILLKLT